MTEIERLITKINDLGWDVDIEGGNEYRLSKYSPYGQDFSITIEGGSSTELIDEIYEAYLDFDVSAEAYLWLDDTGHGRNGAPYEMKDVLADMEACEQMIIDLYRELIKSRRNEAK